MTLTYSGEFLDTEAGPMTMPPINLPSNEPPLETYLHLQQMLLLLKCLDWLWQDRNDYFAAGNLTIYYSMRQHKSEDFKKQIYQDTFRTPEYFWFSPDTLEFAGQVLVRGRYQPIEPNQQGHLWSEALSLFLGIHEETLRFFNAEGQLIPTPEETARQAIHQAQQAVNQAHQAASRADRLAAKLRELGVDPESLG